MATGTSLCPRSSERSNDESALRRLSKVLIVFMDELELKRLVETWGIPQFAQCQEMLVLQLESIIHPCYHEHALHVIPLAAIVASYCPMFPSESFRANLA